METVGLKNSDLMKVELNMSVYGIGYGITHYFDHKLLDSLPQEFLRECWEEMTDKPVLLSGPAYDNSAGDFVPGRYIKKGIIFTSRGCPNKCAWCFVPKRPKN